VQPDGRSCSLPHVQRVDIDETKRKRGHHYVTLFVDMDEKRTLYVTEGKMNLL
jgi:transposase